MGVVAVDVVDDAVVELVLVPDDFAVEEIASKGSDSSISRGVGNRSAVRAILLRPSAARRPSIVRNQWRRRDVKTRMRCIVPGQNHVRVFGTHNTAAQPFED